MSPRYSYVTPGYEVLGFLCERFFEVVLNNIGVSEPGNEQESQLIYQSVCCADWNGIIERFEELEIVAILKNVPSFRLNNVAVRQLNYWPDLTVFSLKASPAPGHFEARYVFQREELPLYMHIEIEAEVNFDSPSPFS